MVKNIVKLILICQVKDESMIIRLFRVFDPLSYFGVGLNWVIIILVIFLLIVNFYVVERGYERVMRGLLGIFGKIFKEIRGIRFIGLVMLRVITLIYLIVINLMGLFPFIFTRTAHPFITIGVGVVF